MKKHFGYTYSTYLLRIANTIVRRNTAETWSVISNHVEHYAIQNWLKVRLDNNRAHREIIAELPLQDIIAWIEQEPQERSAIVTSFSPPSLVDEYGDDNNVRGRLWGHFFSGSSYGPTSIHYRGKRDMFRQWLTKGFGEEVDTWLAENIERLDKMIVKEEMEEERSRF